MRTDLLFDPFGGRWADVREGAVAAGQAGFDDLWLWDRAPSGASGDSPGPNHRRGS